LAFEKMEKYITTETDNKNQIITITEIWSLSVWILWITSTKL
jgi:hypothetical protein